MALTDFNKYKPINVASVTGTPTIAKALPFKIVDGLDSTTGTGDIVLDWTNITTKADIAVYDQNDVLLDYYFESFDATAETAVIWVYKSWTQDGTEQARIAYGDGISDQSVIASTVFDKETDLKLGYLFNETSGNPLDITSNNNDGTNNGATQGATGVVDGAYDFDGTNDYIEYPDLSLTAATNTWAVSLWVNFDILPSSRSDEFYLWHPRAEYDQVIQIESEDDKIYFSTYDGTNNFLDSGITITTSTNYHIVVTSDGDGSYNIYVNGSLANSGSLPTPATKTDTNNIGGQIIIDRRYVDGIIDDFRLYDTNLSTNEISADYSATKSSPTFFSQDAGATTPSTFLTQIIMT